MKLFSVLRLSPKVAAGVIVAILALGAAVGAFASQDMLPGQSPDGPSVQAVEDENDVALQQDQDDAEEEEDDADDGDTDEDDGDTETGQRDIVGIPSDNPNHQPDDGDDVCEKGETAVKTTPSGGQVNVPCHAVNPEDGETDEDEVDNDTDQRDTVGIPSDNPNHQPDDGDDVCEKGETAVKTTPSGKQVNVPCPAIEPGQPGFSHGHHSDGDDSGDDGEEDEDQE